MSEILMMDEIIRQIPCSDQLVMLDRVCIENEKKIIGYKAVSLGEWYFMGHFPGHPIMPGVLQVEAFSQLAELLCWKKLDPERKGDVYMKSLRKVKFRRPSVPGDRIFFTVEIVEETSDSFGFKCTASNNGGLACEALLTMSVRPRLVPVIPAFNQYDKTDSIFMDVSKIESFIPHRYPFLQVDYLATGDDEKTIAVKNACSDERTFRRYADGYRVMSGSIHPEIVAQGGCIGVLAREENRGKLAYFIAIDNVEYLKPVLPGDQLVCDINIPATKSRFGKGAGGMMVNGEIVTKVEVMFALVDP